MSLKTNSNKVMIYIFAFFFTLHITPTIYTDSSFLEQFVGTGKVGYVYAFASFITIFGIFWIRKYLRKLGNYRVLLFILVIETITLIAMIFTSSAVIAVSAYIIGFTVRAIAFFNLDIFLEAISKNSSTGGTRGIFMTALNTAFIIGPLLSSFILTNGDFWKIYSLAAILQIPVFFILIKYMRDFKDPVYQKPKILKTIYKIKENKDIYATLMSEFLLHFFYAWMIVYIPIFLHMKIGFSLSETTTIIGITLIPFVLLEAILGRIADDKLGEKEILGLGFLIMSLSTLLIPFITSKSIIVWAGLLFITRIGASMVEIMIETHIFKRINSSDINVLSVFRSSGSVAYIIATLMGSLFIAIMDFKYLFLILGIILLYGLRYAFLMKDTK